MWSLATVLGALTMVAANNNIRLWYTEPAKEWTQALPIGNGRLGGMVFGDHAAERIQVNEESVWNGGYRSRLNQNAAETVTQVRELLVDEKISEAQKLANLGMVSTPQSMRRYETLGDISIEFDSISEYTNGSYQRWLDLETAIAGVKFDLNGTTIERELFVSAPDDLMVHRLTANGDQKLSFQLRVWRPTDFINVAYETAYSESGDTTFMTGTAGGFDPITFAAGLHGQTDGTVRTLGEFLIIENATEAIIYFAAATTYRVPDPVSAIKQTFSNAHEYTYAQLRQRHIDDYQALYNTCTLELDSSASNGTDLPTNERINATQAGEADLGLIALQFQYGRYLLISSSRPGTLPANLQGIWNEDFQSEWGSKFTVNINTEMNYWPAETTGLSALHTPLFDLIETVRKNGAETAQQMYNASGWVVHHNSDIWGDTSPQDRYPPATYWTLSSAWLCTHILEHYSHTGDTGFLLMKIDTLVGAIQFYLDTLQTYTMNETTYLVTNPSTSPENTFYVPVTNDTGSMTVGPTCDFQILRELFTAFLSAVATLPTNTVSTSFLAVINTTLASFPPYQISTRYPGVIQEWLHDYEEAEPGHRHISHLYALYPGTSIPPPSAPKHNATLWDAASKTLEYRLSNGGAGTGWSRAWTINWYARLLNGSALAENIFQFFNSSTYPNLFDAHPPFQIDGNFGFTAGVAEALMQSHFVDEEDGGAREVWLLPALPEAWTDGKVAGLVARGGFVLDVQWSENKVQGVNITSNLGGKVSVKYEVNGMEGNVGITPIGNGSYDGFQVLAEQGKFVLDTTAGGKYVFEVDWEED
jgi:alpha-L-fucosidase 2